MPRFMFVRTVVVEAEDEYQAWEKLPEELAKDTGDLANDWAVDPLIEGEINETGYVQG